MTDRTRSVFLNGDRIGSMHFRGTLTVFEFDESYQNDPDRSVLGQQFEEDPRAQWRQSARAPVWFANLLPEKGPMLDFIARELGVNPRNEAGLLAELGDDLPGGLGLGVSTEAPPDYGPSLVRSSALHGDSRPQVRFSVAGVQLKLSMLDLGNTLRLAGEGELGGHYVKFPGEYDGVPENEYCMMQLANRCGILTPNNRLLAVAELGALPRGFDRFGNRNAYVVERFDRTESGRIHIEDFCQVVGNWPEGKYEGASYEGLGEMVLRTCGESDFLDYVRRIAFNMVIGNEDAHLKNWSLWYPDRRQPRLSPAYDLVSTVVYPNLDRGTGLRIGGKHSAQRVSLETFTGIAERAGASGVSVRDTVSDLVQRYRLHADEARDLHWLDEEKWRVLADYQNSIPLFSEV